MCVAVVAERRRSRRAGERERPAHEFLGLVRRTNDKVL